MPDLVTHTFTAYFFGLHPRCRRFRWIFYLGVLLPDLISRPIYILWPQWGGYSAATHTPVFAFIFCGLLSEFFAAPLRSPVRLALWAGCGLHFFLDLFQRHIGAGYYWFFPFSWKKYELGWFWPESALPLVPVWIVILLASEMVFWLHRRSRAESRG